MKPTLRPYLNQIMIGILAVLCYAMFFYSLGGIGFIGPDEPRYAAIGREMLMSGDYITPRLNGVPWFEKPPLMYWGAALGALSNAGHELVSNDDSWRKLIE